MAEMKEYDPDEFNPLEHLGVKPPKGAVYYGAYVSVSTGMWTPDKIGQLYRPLMDQIKRNKRVRVSNGQQQLGKIEWHIKSAKENGGQWNTVGWKQLWSKP